MSMMESKEITGARRLEIIAMFEPMSSQICDGDYDLLVVEEVDGASAMPIGRVDGKSVHADMGYRVRLREIATRGNGIYTEDAGTR